MGRPRKPTALKIAEGDQPCRINGREPAARKGLGPVPDWIASDLNALEAWNRLEANLTELGLIKVVDSEAAALYCSTWSLFIKACEEVEDKGLTVATATTVKANPALAIRNACQAQLVRLLTEFGMTPASRAGLHVADQKQDSPLLRWIAMKNAQHGPNQGPNQETPGRS